MRLIRRAASPPARVLDVGAGTSFLVDRLLQDGYRPGVLDVANEPLEIVRHRLGTSAADVEWFVADVAKCDCPHAWDVWHDRAVFHFMTDSSERAAYRNAMKRSTRPGAAVIIATFGPDGPERCSGLPVQRYSPDQLAAELGPEYALLETEWEEHITPTSATQQFVYCLFRRRAAE